MEKHLERLIMHGYCSVKQPTMLQKLKIKLFSVYLLQLQVDLL